MHLAWVLFTIVTGSVPVRELSTVPHATFLKTSLTGRNLVLDDVFLNGLGPFRMLVDTGNATSIVRPSVAKRLNLKPAYSVEQATVSGTRKVPVALLDEVGTGSIADRTVEAIIGDIAQTGVDGVLGQSWLVRHDYLLDYRNRQIVIDGAPAAFGIRLPLSSVDGRPIVAAAVDGRRRELIVDSGASTMVLYEKPSIGASAVRIEANFGSAAAEKFTAHIALAGGREQRLEALRLDVTGLGPGLLPASAFASVFVSNRSGFVQIIP